MTIELDREASATRKTEPLCPVFGTCGGCAHQDKPYAAELKIKEQQLRVLFSDLDLKDSVFRPIVASPEPYHYRNRLDLTFRKTRKEGMIMGFQHAGTKRLIQVDACPIARKEVSDFMPELKRQAIEKLPENYRNANLVVKTGDDGRVYWGGIGRRSLRMQPEDYLWTEIQGKRIYYSLDTFFQANLSILSPLMQTIERLAEFTPGTIFFDLYGGVGLFGIYFANRVGRVILIEESRDSTTIAKFNAACHDLKDFEIYESKVEDCFSQLMNIYDFQKRVAIVDPPRKGLSSSALETLVESKHLMKLFYLSCSPESLARDLKSFLANGWKVKDVIPFDFFPKTVHLETLVLLEPS